MKSKNAILDEIHAAREQFARQHGYDVRRMGQTLQREEVALSRKVISLPPRRAKPRNKAS